MSDIHKLIDHTALKPDITKNDIETLCKEAIDYKFATVCVNPYWVKLAAQLLNDADVAVATVVGFPLGAATTDSKVFEAKNAVENGATEIDMVMNIGELKSSDEDAVEEDIRAVVESVTGKALVKVIIETSLLNDDEKVRACKASVSAGAHFVKTSTGFSGGGATVEDIKLMRETVGSDIGVKASGGIRDRAAAEAMIQAGATRIGASSGIAIVNGDEGTSTY